MPERKGTAKSSARKLKYLRGKLSWSSTTVATIQDGNGQCVDVTEKTASEQAILASNEEKIKQSFHTPFLLFPLFAEFGFQGLGPS